MSFDAGRIEATSHLDNSPFRQGLLELRRLGKEAEKPLHVPVDVDTKKADADVIDFKTRVKRTVGKTSVELVLDNAKATRKLVDTSDRLDRLRASVAQARVTADTEQAKRRLDELDIQLRRIGLITSRPRVTVDGVQRANLQLDSLALKLAAISSAGGGAGRRGGSGGFLSGAASHAPGFGALAIGAAAPLVAPAAGLLAGAGASLLTPTLAGGIGLGIFGAAAKGNIQTVTKDVATLNKLTAQYNAATTNKQRAAVLAKEAALWKGMDPAQRQAVKNVDKLEESWKRFQKRLEPQSFAAFAGAASLANTGLKYLLPTAQAVGDVIVDLETRAGHAFKQPFWHQFFGDFLPGEAARSVDTFGTAFGHLLSGGAHLMEDFAPLGHDLENVVVRLTGRFDTWTQGNGPVRFVNWVEAHGPEAAKALEGIAHGLEGLGKGLGPIASVELKALTPVLNFIGDLGDQHPEVITALGGALLAVGGGLKAIQAAKGLSGAASAIKGLLGGGGGGGGGRGGSPATPLYVVDVGSAGGKTAVAGGAATTAEEVAAGAGGAGVLARLRTGAAGAARSVGPMAVGTLAATNIVVNQTKLSGHASVIDRIINGIGSAGVFGTQSGELGHAAKTLPYDPTLPQLNAQTGKLKATGVAGVMYAPTKLTAQQIKDAAAGVAFLNKTLVTNTGLARENTAALAREVPAIRRIGTAFLELPAAEQKALRGLVSLPRYLRDAVAAAESGGFAIGKNLADGITIGLQNGSGKVSLTAVSVVNGALRASHHAADARSPSRKMIQLGRWMAEGLAIGFGAQLPQVEALFAKGTASALNRVQAVAQSRLDSARQQLVADQQNQAGYASSLAGNLLGGANLTGAISSNGAVGNLSGYLGNYANSLGVFSTDLAKLKKAGLAPALLQQIADAGPQQGIGLAQSILSGASGSIKTLNADYSKISRLSNTIGGSVASTVYGAQVARDKKSVDLLARIEKVLTALLKEQKGNPHAVAAALHQLEVAGHAQTKVTPKR